jgi:hypothetical protein
MPPSYDEPDPSYDMLSHMTARGPSLARQMPIHHSSFHIVISRHIIGMTSYDISQFPVSVYTGIYRDQYRNLHVTVWDGITRYITSYDSIMISHFWQSTCQYMLVYIDTAEFFLKNTHLNWYIRVCPGIYMVTVYIYLDILVYIGISDAWPEPFFFFNIDHM